MSNISSVRIFGERCSGTNYLESLLIENLPICSDRKAIKGGVYGYKHWFCENWGEISKADDTLFIVIFRNPVKWLTSLNKTPFHSSLELKELVFSDFIRSEWSSVWDEDANVDVSNPKYSKEMLHERNPLTGERFSNVLELRTEKLKNWQSLEVKAKNVSFVSYENLTRSPEDYFSELSERFNLESKKKFKNITSRRGYGRRKFVPKPDPVISNADAQYICDNLDWSLEARFGYSKDDVYNYVSDNVPLPLNE